MSFAGRIKSAVRRFDGCLSRYGLSPIRFVRAVIATPGFVSDYAAFKGRLGAKSGWVIGPLSPVFDDRNQPGGAASGHYFHQDLLVAQRIWQRNPARHIDAGSRVDGFVAHVASFRAIEYIDIRPLPGRIRNVTFRHIDLMAPLAAEHREICDSLSCLHALEHFGLGRYGDRLDPDGYATGFAALAKMLKPGGILYFSTPVGRERIEFNAQRVFGCARLLRLFEDNGLALLDLSYVDDGGDLVESVAVTPALIARLDRMDYACGIFELRKNAGRLEPR